MGLMPGYMGGGVFGYGGWVGPPGRGEGGRGRGELHLAAMENTNTGTLHHVSLWLHMCSGCFVFRMASYVLPSQQ